MQGRLLSGRLQIIGRCGRVKQLAHVLDGSCCGFISWLDLVNVNVNVNVEDTIFWLSPTIESCNRIDFIYVAYVS